MSQSAGPFGCFSYDATTTCAPARSQKYIPSVAVSPDGRFVYAVADSGVLPSDQTGSLSIFARDTATGNLTELAGTAGCVSQNGSDGLGGTTCATGKGMRGAKTVVVSPDGRSVYVGSSNSASPATDTIAVFNRDPATGQVTQPAGAAACLTDGANNTDPDCTTVQGPLLDIRQLVVTDDNRFVYGAIPEDAGAGNDGAIIAFSRDPATSALTQLAGTNGCVSNSATGCATGRALREPNSLVLSPDGNQLYVAASEGRKLPGDEDGALAVLNRNATTGVLSQPAGTAGCLNASGDDGTGPGSCAKLTTGKALHDANGIVVSPDGRNLYVASQGINGNAALQYGTLSVFARDPSSGAVSQPAGLDACISQDGSDGANTAGLCTPGRAMHEPTGLAITPDGANVYLGSSDAPSAISAFAREAATGRLTQLAGSDGCTSIAGSDGGLPPANTCAPGTAITGASALAVTFVGACSIYVALEDVSALGSFVRQPGCATTTPPVTTPAPVVAPPSSKPPALATLNASKVFTLPSTKTCLSKRAFRIRLKLPGGVKPASATVLVNGKRVKTLKAKQLTAGIDLRGLPKGRFTVAITLKTSDGRTVKTSRRYRTCTKKARR